MVIGAVVEDGGGARGGDEGAAMMVRGETAEAAVRG